METFHINAARDHRYISRIDIVVPYHVPPARRALGHQSVAALQYLTLDLKSATGFLFPGKPGRGVLRITQGVRHVHDGEIKGGTKAHRYPAGEPVVTVDEIVLQIVVTDKVQHPVHEFGQMVQDTVFAVRCCRACRQVNDTRAVRKINHSGIARILAAGIYVHSDAQIAQMPAQLANVDIHATGFAAAQSGQWTAVHAEHGYPPGGQNGGRTVSHTQDSCSGQALRTMNCDSGRSLAPKRYL